MLDQGREVIDVLLGAPLGGRALALTVAPAVIGQDPEPLGQGRHDEIPGNVVAPRAVDEHKRWTVSGERIEQADAVDSGGRHRQPPQTNKHAVKSGAGHATPA